MQKLLLVSGALLLDMAPARADRPLTEEERMKLETIATAQGCTGGKMEFDDGGYEVNGARCSDGKIYDLKFDAGFNLIKKKNSSVNRLPCIPGKSSVCPAAFLFPQWALSLLCCPYPG